MAAHLSVDEFIESVKKRQQPSGLSIYQEALWEEGCGNWEKAHALIQDLPDKQAALLHAYLHRVEGDEWNARYWYNRAGASMPALDTKEEWKELVKRFLT
ncbi:hypothetical protein GCM10027036_04380 [Flavihumibacter cheonanensis]|jgi:hypothetical protein|uniref:hypothetical protein n=1 Tax=Flavihumibacter cheonanensis TaxID=1442385 RepID=UPI001EF9002D|nr:hypothetical protein [Flavihumibacter cheonanensis]MCG7752118.1 hypothetical protein [Flavihumibacter cheonanensis]